MYMVQNKSCCVTGIVVRCEAQQYTVSFKQGQATAFGQVAQMLH